MKNCFGCDSDSMEDLRAEFSRFPRAARRPCFECGQWAGHHPNCPCNDDSENEEDSENEG